MMMPVASGGMAENNKGGATFVRWFGRLGRALACAALIAAAFGSVASKADSVTTAFTFTGGPETFVVPDGVTVIQVDAYGASGGHGQGSPPGTGGRVVATIHVTPGQH